MSRKIVLSKLEQRRLKSSNSVQINLKDAHYIIIVRSRDFGNRGKYDQITRPDYFKYEDISML